MIVAVVTISALVGLFQEDKAEKALIVIRQLISPRANAWRDGRRTNVPLAELVPGALVLIKAGDRVFADMRMVRARSLLIDEAMLTGESVASEKRQDPVTPDAPLGDRLSMAFSGKLVAAGQGPGIVLLRALTSELVISVG